MSQGDPIIREHQLPVADQEPITHPIGMAMPTTELPPTAPQLL